MARLYMYHFLRSKDVIISIISSMDQPLEQLHSFESSDFLYKVLTPLQRKYPVDFDDELKIRYVRYDNII